MANNFSLDSDIVAVWPFEQNGNDIQGNNDLTEYNTPGYSSVNYKEGSYALDLDGTNEYLSIADADLDADFPLKSGGSETIISTGGWFRVGSDVNMAVCSKWNASANKRSILLYYAASGNTLDFFLGYNSGASYERITMFSGLTVGRWYHLGFSYNLSTKAWSARLWDDVLETASTNSGTTTNSMYICDVAWCIGSDQGGNYWDENIDEWIVAKRVISNDDWALIQAGEYTGGGQTELEDVSLNLSAFHQALSDLSSFLRAHDGLEFRDLEALLAAFHENEEDLATSLWASFESMTDLKAFLETWATGYKDLGMVLDLKARKIEDMAVLLQAGKVALKDLSIFLSAADGIVLRDLSSCLCVTDGVVEKDLCMSLQAISAAPAFRTITAQRLASVIHEVP